MKAINKKWLFILLVLIFTFAIATPAFAQDPEPPTADQVNDIALGHQHISGCFSAASWSSSCKLGLRWWRRASPATRTSPTP